jgi:hypothetical protein
MLAPAIERRGKHLAELPKRELNDDAEVVSVARIGE